jgi:hypothetical protein
MKSQARIWAVVLAAMTYTRADGGEPADWQPRQPNFFQRLSPRGGWNPDGGGLFHWWNPHCFPRSCGPDDYCRKPMPRVCRPGAPLYVGGNPHPQPIVGAPAHSP